MPDTVVEQAKGVLMFRYGVSSYEALAVLGRWAAESGYSLSIVARAITLGVCQGRWGTGRPDAGLVRWLENRLRAEVADAVTPIAGAT